jgi:iron complex transport system substrate-binding protein
MERDRVFRNLLVALPVILAVGICTVDGLIWLLTEKPQRAETDESPKPAPPFRATSPSGSVQRVGTPGISMASLILVLSGRHKLAAITPEVRDNPWLARIAPEVSSLPTPFSRPAGVNTEALLATKPDLVTLWQGNEPLGGRLEALAIPVLQMSYSTPEEMKAAIRQLGQALGREEMARGEDLIAYYERNLQRVAVALRDLPERARPRVYYASIAPLYTEGGKSMVNAWIEAAGGINVAARGGLQGDGQVHLEDVVRWDPEIIVTLDAAGRQAILDDPRWRMISAVRNRRVLVNPKGINAWCTRAAEAALQVLWAAGMFHPELFPDLDMAGETRRFYRQFYAYELNDDELAHLLQGLPPPAPNSPTPARKKS